MPQVLVKFDTWYCDEFNVKGFRIMTRDEFNDMMNTLFDIRNIKKADQIPYISIGFGANEDLEFDDAEELMDCFDVTDISDEQANTLAYFFGKEYGYWPMPALEGWLHDMIVERDMN